MHISVTRQASSDTEIIENINYLKVLCDNVYSIIKKKGVFPLSDHQMYNLDKKIMFISTHMTHIMKVDLNNDDTNKRYSSNKPQSTAGTKVTSCYWRHLTTLIIRICGDCVFRLKLKVRGKHRKTYGRDVMCYIFLHQVIQQDVCGKSV